MLGSLLTWLFNFLFGKRDPSAERLADSSARAEEQLAQETVANETITKAARVGADADARVVRALTDANTQHYPVDEAVNDKLRQQFGDDFRD